MDVAHVVQRHFLCELTELCHILEERVTTLDEGEEAGGERHCRGGKTGKQKTFQKRTK